MAAAVFGVQLLLVWLVAERPGHNGWAGAAKSSVRLFQQEGRGLSALDEALQADPAWFSLPHPRSFSGPAWLVPVPVQFEIPRTHHAPQWLPPPVVWGADFTDFLRTNQLLAVTRLDSPNPPLTVVKLPPRGLESRSSFRVAGPAEARLQRPVPELPLLPLRSLLPGLEVEVDINAEGNVITARLLEKMTAATREQQADLTLAGRESLTVARKLTFAKASGWRDGADPFAYIETVRIVFDWAPLPPQESIP